MLHNHTLYFLIQGEPYLIDTVSCQYIFNWNTNLMCHGNNPSQPMESGTCEFSDVQRGYTYDLTPLKKTTADSLFLGYKVSAGM